MFIALLVIHVLVAVSLVLVVLLQTGRGAELGAAFGGMGQATYGRTQSTFITKFTTSLAVVFMLTSMALALITTQRPSGSLIESNSVMQPTASQPATEQPPAETPAEPAPAPLQQQAAPQQPAKQ